MKSKTTPTIIDVAELAGVSVGTVSRVLSDNKTVGSDLRQRVQTAVAELRYRPNQTARAMRTNKFSILGLVVPDIGNPFFGQIAREVEIAAELRGYSVLVANSHGDPDRESRQIHSMLERSLSGLIVVACSDQTHAGLKKFKTPIISLDRRLGDYPLASIDNEHMSKKLGALIAEYGHRRVVYVSGPLSTRIARQRQTGFKTGFEENASQGSALRIIEGDFSFEAGETLARELLKEADRPTAIIGANDQIAIGVMRAARDCGVDVPAELSVAGFDNTTLAPLVVPSLTTIAQPVGALAASALQQIVDDWPNAEDIIIPSELIVRQSTGPWIDNSP